MATTLPAESTHHARNTAQKSMAVDHVQRIGGLSRIVDRDIEILKMNVQLRALNWVVGVLGPPISSRTRQVVRWAREPARRAELHAAALKVWSFVSSAALAGAKHASNGWCGLQGVVRRQAESLESTWSRLEGKWQTWRAARSQSAEIEASTVASEVDSLAGYATGLLPPD